MNAGFALHIRNALFDNVQSVNRFLPAGWRYLLLLPFFQFRNHREKPLQN
jgi:hypothetical protein